MEIQATEKSRNNGQREKGKKKGFSEDGGARGVDGWACRRQTHLLEEASVQTVSHAPPRTGWCAFQPEWKLSENLACKSC